MEPHENIVEISDATFARDVVEASHERPVVVDFWAEWCQPCRLLTPTLEKIAHEFAGRATLVKARVEDNSAAAGRYGVGSIPAVLAFRNGQPVDAFVGVVPESQVRAFFERVMPTIAEQRVAEARQLEATDPDAALAKYREAVADSGPLESAARIALAAFLLARGMLDECHAQIAELEQRGYLEPEAEQVKARLLLERGSHEAGSLEQARAKVRAHPDDFAARLHLAEALAAAGEHAEALETALDLVERDRKGTGEAARKLMIAIFNLLSNDSPLAADFRRRLSFVL